MTQPLVTIVATVFSRTQFLEEALQSAVDQTYRKLEIIVTDDANSERVRSTCAKFASDARIRYRSNLSTLGAPLNIRAALAESSGEYVVILNDDDIMEPFMIETLLPPLQEDERCIVSFGDHWIIDLQGNILREATDRNTRFWRRDRIAAGKIDNPFSIALRGGIPFVMGTVFRNAACSREWLAPNVEGAYDSWLALQLSLSGGDFYFNPRRVFKYRVHAKSESARVAAEKARAQVFIFSNLATDPRAYPEHSYIRRTLAHFLFVLGRDRLYFEERSSAREAFVHSLKQHMSARSLLGAALTWIPGNVHRLILRLWRLVRGIEAELPAKH